MKGKSAVTTKRGERFKKIVKRLIIIAVIATIAISTIVHKEQERRATVNLSYDELISYVQDEKIAEMEVPESGNTVTFTLKDGRKGKADVYKEAFTEFLQKELENNKDGEKLKIKIEEDSSNAILNFLSLIFMILPVVGVIYMITRAGKMMSKTEESMFKSLEEAMGGKYTVKPAKSKVKFSDVAGIDEEKEQIQEVVDFLKNPEKYKAAGARIPRGVLMNGEPGTGKTLMAKAIAGEAGVPFFQENGANFDEKFVGVGASRMRQLFDEAKENAPCIIFIDEFDTIAQNRYSGQSYSEQTLNELLSKMDGFESDDDIVVIAATNHIEVLDPAITRRGRFDRHIYVPMPDQKAREEILKVHARGKKLSSDVNLEEIARKTRGFSGADLESVLNEAVVHAVRQGKSYASLKDVDEAIEIVLVGLQKKNKAVSKKDMETTAIHEAGHAIVSAVIRPEVKNFCISIVPRGAAGGYNFFDTSEQNCRRKKDLVDKIKVCYGGRAAEEVLLKDISSGASGDLESASKIALQMITSYGMKDTLMVKVSGERDYNKEISTEAIAKAEEICQSAYNEVLEIVEKHSGQILKLSALLLEKERLNEEEVSAFMKENIV